MSSIISEVSTNPGQAQCHGDHGAQLVRTAHRQRIAHHRSEAEAGGEDPALVDAQIRGDEGEQVVEVDAVLGPIPIPADGVCVGRYEDGRLLRIERFATEPEIRVVFCVEVGPITSRMQASRVAGVRNTHLAPGKDQAIGFRRIVIRRNVDDDGATLAAARNPLESGRGGRSA